MPKIKTKRACKERFRITGTGKIKFKHSGKSHFMTRRSKVQIRDKRKDGYVSKGVSRFVLKNFLSYFKKLRKVL
ncbi:MAG: 50S ribosomal protein L35 [Rickettsiales bacterium]|jgi:large subunit ribosomal protein L35|nr:50S ribosomal protein L35 [Rickettsiales bacterium]